MTKENEKYPKVFEGFTTPILRSIFFILIPILFYAYSSDTPTEAFLIGISMYIISIWWLACYRFYTICLFKKGIGIKNRWRLFGSKKWKIKNDEISTISTSFGNDRDIFDIKLQVNDKEFLLLLNSKTMRILDENLKNTFPHTYISYNAISKENIKNHK